MAMRTRPFLRRPARQRRGGSLRQNTVWPVEPLEARTLLAFASLGPEFRVNTTTADEQSSPSVAADADGDFVVAWQSYLQDGSGFGVYAQRYNAAGVAQGGEFRVNTTTASEQASPSVADDAHGDFEVAWQSLQQHGDGYGVDAQRDNAAGVEQGGRRRDNAVGRAQGGDFRVNTTLIGKQRSPDMGAQGEGAFVVVWESFGQDGSGGGMYAQRYNAAGVAQGGEFRVNTTTASDQASPSVAADADGDFVVAWQSYLQDGSGYGVYAQRYNAAGVAQGGEFRVNTTTAGSQASPSVAADADGDFVVAW